MPIMSERQKKLLLTLLKCLLIAIAWRVLIGFISFITLADRGTYNQIAAAVSHAQKTLKGGKA